MKSLSYSFESLKCVKRCLLHGLLLLACLLPLDAVDLPEVRIRVIDEAAIPYMAFLSKAQFDQRFPGVIKSDIAELESGWYVIYVHESLNYYFGPILLKSTGQDYLAQLTKTVEAAVEQRASIQDYQLALSYEPSAGSSEKAGSGDGSGGGSEGGNGFGSSEPPGEAPSSIGFWEFIRRIFR